MQQGPNITGVSRLVNSALRKIKTSVVSALQFVRILIVRNKIRSVILGVVVLFAIVAGITAFIGQRPSSSEASKFDASLPVEYTNPELNVDLTKEFSFDVGYDLTKLEGYKPIDGPKSAIEVFVDPGLTIEAKDAYVSDPRGKLVVKPAPEGTVVADYLSGEAKDVALANPGEWGFNDQYFIVRKLDSRTGKKLAKPLVTRFTVQKQIQKPQSTFTVDNQGIGHFTWNPIDRASKYYVVKSEVDQRNISIIGSTTKSTWSTAEQDAHMKTSLARDPNSVSSQNYDFKIYNYSEDDMRDTKNPVYADQQKITKSMYGVIAVVDDDMSSLGVINDTTVNSRLPHAIAYNAAAEMKATGNDVKTLESIPSQIPVTMDDGTTVLRPVILDLDNVTKGELIHATQLDDGSYTNKRTVSTIKIPYSVGGTMFKGEYRTEFYTESTYRDKLAQIWTRNQEAQTKTGGNITFNYRTEKQDLSDVAISKTAPKVDYRVNSTNAFTAYLAANMIAGNEYIDVSAYLSDKSGIDVNDAAQEADEQNAYILGLERTNYISSAKVLQVTYRVPSKEVRVKEQQAIAAEVDAVVGKIITNGMNDGQKVKAINDYIIQTATYDYDALDSIDKGTTKNFAHAWTPAGILIDKTAVCGGYAITFKALADKAGLESMFVSGMASGGLHAWNKVKVDGVWKFIDTTWNDNDAQPNQFYLLTDTQANETRTQYDTFVIDILVDNYATN